MQPSAVVGALGGRVGLYETATVRVDPTGTINVFTGTHSHGQGHDTTFAQIVSDKLGVPIGNIEIIHGDTNRIPFGMGFMVHVLLLLRNSISKAVDKIIEKGKIIAAHLMEASDADIDFQMVFIVSGTDNERVWRNCACCLCPAQLSARPSRTWTGRNHDPLNFTYPAGTHIAEVEVDPMTGG